MLASAFHTVINGWDVVVALLVVVIVAVLDHAVTGLPRANPSTARVWSWSWGAYVTLFAVVMFGCALTVRW